MHQVFEGDVLSLGAFDSSILEHQSIGGHFEHFSSMPQQLTFQVLGSPLDGESHHDRGAAGVGVDVIGRYIGIELSHGDTAQWNTQYFGNNLAQRGARALPDLDVPVSKIMPP